MLNEKVIKAIETTYNGVVFRSRLEARWAVFMDELGAKWFYEPEGFKLSSGWYVPDFFLPNLDCWIEIKPSLPSAVAIQLLADLVAETAKPGFLFFGMPGEHEDDRNAFAVFPIKEATGIAQDPCDEHEAVDFDEGYQWCECPICGKLDIRYQGMTYCEHTGAEIRSARKQEGVCTYHRLRTRRRLNISDAFAACNARRFWN